MRRGFTLTELMVAMAIGMIATVVAYAAVHLMARAERTTDRHASRTLAEARLAEMLIRDLRSAAGVTRDSDTAYRITRWVLEQGKMVKREATWRVVDKVRVMREMPGEPRTVFDFDGLLDPDQPAFKFRVEPPDDAVMPSDPQPSPEPGG